MTQIYILVDDEVATAAPAEIYTEAVEASSNGAIRILTHRPTSLSGVLTFIADAKPNGLLLDVALTNALDLEGGPLAFDGIALAQQIRTLQTRNLRQGIVGLPEFPLIRFSKKDVIGEYVSGDNTSDDLFDEKIEKEQVLADPQDCARRAASLAEDYPAVTSYARGRQTDASLSKLLGIPAEMLPRMEPRAWLGLRRSDAPAHVLSRYLTGVILARPGPLIDEELLAVRLGVDREGSSDWPKLIEQVGAAYRGVFGDGYRRWWMISVLDWWEQAIDPSTPPFRSGATQRVESIRAATGLAGIEAIQPMESSPGAKYWHLCIRSGLPVDPSEGTSLMPVWGQESWQDPDYLCLEEAKRDWRSPRMRASERTRLKAAIDKGKSP